VTLGKIPPNVAYIRPQSRPLSKAVFILNEATPKAPTAIFANSETVTPTSSDGSFPRKFQEPFLRPALVPNDETISPRPGQEPPSAVRALPGGKREKVKIAPFRFDPLRNFFNSSTPPFFVPNLSAG
jgi:hypothetical protein